MKYQTAWDLKYRGDKYSVPLEITADGTDFRLTFPDGTTTGRFMEAADKLEALIKSGGK